MVRQHYHSRLHFSRFLSSPPLDILPITITLNAFIANLSSLIREGDRENQSLCLRAIIEQVFAVGQSSTSH